MIVDGRGLGEIGFSQLVAGRSVFLVSRILQVHDQVRKTLHQRVPNMVSSAPRITKNGDHVKEVKNEFLKVKVCHS